MKTATRKRVLLLNVLYIPHIGGVENSLTALAREYTSRGCHVTLLCSNRGLSPETQLPEREATPQAQIIRYPVDSSWIGFLSQFIHCRALIRSLVRAEGEFSVVVSRNAVTTICAYLAGLRDVHFLIPEVSLIKDAQRSSFSSPKQLLRYIKNSFVQSLAFFCASSLWVFSRSMQRQIRLATFGLRSATRLAPGVDLTRFFPLHTEQRTQLRLQLEIPDGKVFLALGRFSEVKCFELAILALQYLPIDYILILVGSGPQENIYRQCIAEHHLTDRVFIFEATQQPEKFYQAADVFLMTSRYESFGQVLLEASASGLPIAALPGEGSYGVPTQEIYEHYPALLHESSARSPQELAQAMQRALNFPKDEFHSQREQFSQEYSWSALSTVLEQANLKSPDSPGSSSLNRPPESVFPPEQQ